MAEPTDGEDVVITSVAVDGTTVIALIDEDGLQTWKDPDRPGDLPWYDPATDRCK